MQSYFVNNNSIRKAEGSSGIGVFTIPRDSLTDTQQMYLRNFTVEAEPLDIPKFNRERDNLDAYITALELGGYTNEWTVLVLSCLNAGIILPTDTIYEVDHRCKGISESEGTVKVTFSHTVEGEYPTEVHLDIPTEQYLALKMSRELGFIVKITGQNIIFCYYAVPYFTKRVPITAGEASVRQIRKVIASEDYMNMEKLANTLEPEYMGSFKAHHVVHFSSDISAGNYRGSFVFHLGGKLIKTEADPIEFSYNTLTTQYMPVILISDEKEGLALYY